MPLLNTPKACETLVCSSRVISTWRETRVQADIQGLRPEIEQKPGFGLESGDSMESPENKKFREAQLDIAAYVSGSGFRKRMQVFCGAI
jgi:hypothetical protein